jgi:hypothetical protein
MLLWRFETFVSPSGRTDVQDSINRYRDYAREAFSRQVAHLAVSPLDQWHEPYAKKLKNENPLYEIRYKADNKATRALGYFRKSSHWFTILLIASHKGNVYTPPDAFKSAHFRARQVEDGSAKTVPLQIDGEDFPPDEG